MKILYIYPHPDDESFGPAHAMHRQLRQGHNVYLLTLTRGGATKQRFKYNLSIEEMGEVRYKEMLKVEKVLGLTRMTVLDLPDGGLKEMDPREIEKVVEKQIHQIKPDILVSYPVAGISGFYDHLVMHAVAKRVFVVMKEKYGYPKRLAFQAPSAQQAEQSSHFPLKGLKENEIDCIFKVEKQDIAAAHKALDCYETFQETIEKSRVKKFIKNDVYFEFFGESFNPPLKDLTESLSDNQTN